MFKSLEQRKKFYELKDQGKITQATIDEWEKDTPKNLPTRVTPKKPLVLGHKKKK